MNYLKPEADGFRNYRPGTLSNDFFFNINDMDTVWNRTDADGDFFEAQDAKTGEKFVKDFVSAWNKVMNADRYDLA